MQQQDIGIFAELLSDATHKLAKFKDKIIVVKYGGNAMVNEELKQAVMQDLLLLNQIGLKVALVHGGGT